MLAIPQPVPVEQQPKAIVRVSAQRRPIRQGRGVRPLRAIRGVLAQDGPIFLDDLKLHPLGFTHPAGEHAHATLKRRWPRILQIPGQQGRLEDIAPGLPPVPFHDHHHLSGLDPSGQPKVPPHPAAVGCDRLCIPLPHRALGIGGAGGLDHQHAGVGGGQDEIIRITGAVELPGGPPGGGNLRGSTRGVAVVVAATPATATTATTTATTTARRALRIAVDGQLQGTLVRTPRSRVVMPLPGRIRNAPARRRARILPVPGHVDSYNKVGAGSHVNHDPVRGGGGQGDAARGRERVGPYPPGQWRGVRQRAQTAARTAGRVRVDAHGVGRLRAGSNICFKVHAGQRVARGVAARGERLSAVMPEWR